MGLRRLGAGRVDEAAILQALPPGFRRRVAPPLRRRRPKSSSPGLSAEIHRLSSKSTIRTNYLTVDPSGLFRHQKGNHIRYVLRAA
jgi:hypothetical protein